MAQINVDVKPRGTSSAYVVGPFDTGKEELVKAGYRIISLEENARLRMQEGAGADISRNGNWTREGVLYVPQKGIFLTKNSLIMENAKQATECHRNGQDFYLTAEQVEKGLVGSVQLKAGVIPVERFGEDEVTIYAFGKEAQKYGDFLKEAKIDEMPVYLASVGDKAFTRQMWFRSLGNRSELSGNLRSLGYGDRVRGVQDGAEGTVTKKIEAYTPAQMEIALTQLGFSGISQGLVDKLRNSQ